MDKSINFGAARNLRSKPTSCVWATFDQIWSQTYIGHQDVLSTDRGWAFTSIEWENVRRANGIKYQISGVKGHNALGEGERYYSFLRAVYSKILLDQPDMDADYVLGAAIKVK